MLTVYRPTVTSSMKLGEVPAVVVVDVEVAVGVVDVGVVVDVVGVVVGVVVVVVVGDKEIKTDTVNNSRPTRPKVVMIRSYSREEKHL